MRKFYILSWGVMVLLFIVLACTLIKLYVEKETNLIENEFEKLNKIFNDINLEFDKNKISILSMGMTSDYELAIKHGSNMIRIGSGLLGNS